MEDELLEKIDNGGIIAGLHSVIMIATAGAVERS